MIAGGGVLTLRVCCDVVGSRREDEICLDLMRDITSK